MTRPTLTVAQAARICKVSPATVRSWIHRGHITRSRRGLVSTEELLRWLDEHRRASMIRPGRAIPPATIETPAVTIESGG
jgi:excisionase family DNA binding protein